LVARFSLAINSNNLEISFKNAQELKDKLLWHQLAAEALRQGHQAIYEIALQNVKEFDKLSFLYTINGDTEKLKKMQDIAT
jgi:coatomer protein complex subunit alpha (xenin)